MGRPKKENQVKLILTLPAEIAATLDYLVDVAKFGNTKSDLVLQLINNFVDEKRNTLNDSDSWKEFRRSLDQTKKDTMKDLVSKYITNPDSDTVPEVEDEDE